MNELLSDYNYLRDKGIVKVYSNFKLKYFGSCKNKEDFYYSMEYRHMRNGSSDVNFYKTLDLICLMCNWHTARLDEKFKLLDILERTIVNRYKRFNRLLDRVTYIYSNYSHSIFVTLTFTNQYVNCKSHRKFVSDFLKANCDCYVANVDFGEQYNRLHYHAVCSNRINPKLWKYGNCDVKLIRKASEGKISTYMLKLTSHAIKDTTNQKVIYSRLPRSKKNNNESEE